MTFFQTLNLICAFILICLIIINVKYQGYMCSSTQYTNYTILIAAPFCMKLGSLFLGLLCPNIIFDFESIVLDNIFTILVLHILIDAFIKGYIKSRRLAFLLVY